MLYETFDSATPSAKADDSTMAANVTDATDQAQAITEAIQNMEDTINTLDPVRKAITTEQAVALQNANVSQQLFDAAQGAEQAGVAFERAKQLEASGEYIAQMQERVLKRNRQALGGMNADIMTAKRVATINQQNTIYADNVTDYLQTSIIFLCVAIVIMFGFGMGMSLLKGVMAHPVVLMQALLILLATVYIIVMLYKVITNWNHYRMLYQERVFPLYKFDDEDVKGEECDCPEAKVVQVREAKPKDPCADDDTPAPETRKPLSDTIVERASDSAEATGDISNTSACQTTVQN